MGPSPGSRGGAGGSGGRRRTRRAQNPGRGSSGGGGTGPALGGSLPRLAPSRVSVARRQRGTVLRGGDLFRGLPGQEYNQCVEFLRPQLSFVRVNPGQTIFKQGDRADFLYLVRLGHVRVSIARPGRGEMVPNKDTYCEIDPTVVDICLRLLEVPQD